MEEIKRKLQSGQIVKITVKVIPNAKKNFIEKNEDIIKIKINKPALEGKANKAVIELLSGVLEVPKTNIAIIRGEKSSLKDLQITPKSHIIRG